MGALRGKGMQPGSFNVRDAYTFFFFCPMAARGRNRSMNTAVQATDDLAWTVTSQNKCLE